ncbi:MAG: phenylacetate--CoA ligase family protein [Armatimonadota bacterium]
MGIWNQRYETMPREELQQVQLERLQAIVNRAYENVAFYKRAFYDAGLSPDEIRSLDDLSRLPFTDGDHLLTGYPYDAFAVSLRDVVRVHLSPRPTGSPIVCGYTMNDLHSWTELAARTLTAGGVEKDDVLRVFFGYGMFAGGFGFQQGAERIGASVILASADDTDSGVQSMRDFNVTVLAGTPAYAMALANQIEEAGWDIADLSLRVGLFDCRPWTQSSRESIEKRLRIRTSDYYGLNEMASPGVAWECEHRCGLHVAEDHFIAEIIDPVTGRPADAGCEGELVLTSLMKEALPLLRYRTGDLTSLDTTPCLCGRTSARMIRTINH